MTTSTTTHTDLHTSFRDDLADAGFAPLDGDASVLAHDFGLGTRDCGVLTFFAGKGWDAFRLESGSPDDGWASLIRWSDDGIDLMSIDRNGVINADAHFGWTATGCAWAISAADAFIA